MATVKQREAAEAIERLHEWVKPGDTLYCILRHRSRSAEHSLRAAAAGTLAGPVAGWSIGQLDAYVGKLSENSKMPGPSYDLPTHACITGSKLAKVAGSTCAGDGKPGSGCYAMRGPISWPGSVKAQERRLEATTRPLWSEAIAELVNRRGYREFRFHAAGDVQSAEHLDAINRVAELAPGCDFWIPTREYAIVARWFAARDFKPAAPNLSIRMSAHVLGGVAPTFPRLKGLVTISTVSRTDDVYPDAHHCPSRFQDHSCGACRACWSPDVAHVDYHAH